MKKRNPIEKMHSEIAEDFSVWLKDNPKAPRKKKVQQFNAIADAHHYLRLKKLRTRRESGLERESSPVR